MSLFFNLKQNSEAVIIESSSLSMLNIIHNTKLAINPDVSATYFYTVYMISDFYSFLLTLLFSLEGSSLLIVNMFTSPLSDMASHFHQLTEIVVLVHVLLEIH